MADPRAASPRRRPRLMGTKGREEEEVTIGGGMSREWVVRQRDLFFIVGGHDEE
jgi:hypothetical protein